MQIADVLDQYLVQLAADGRSPHTLGQARRHVRLFADWAAGAGLCGDVAKITHQHLALFLTSTPARTRPDGGVKKASSVNALRSSLRAFFSYAHASGATAINPAHLVRRARTGAPPPKTVPAEDLEALTREGATGVTPTAVRDRVLFTTLLKTGIRVGAAVGLEIEDVDLARLTLTIRTKGDVTQTVPITTEVRDMISPLIGDRVTGPVFAAADGSRLSTRHVARRLAEACARAGIARISPHQLRHCFATGLYQRTGDIRLVQAALGHRSIVSTQVYAQVDGDRLRAAIAG